MGKTVHIIWDNSNIFLSGKNHCSKFEYQENGFRIHFQNLIDLAADGRKIEQVFCVGSIPPPTDSVWEHIKAKTGKLPELYERGAASGKEQAVDQALQTRMLRLGYDYVPAQTLILLTGNTEIRGHDLNCINAAPDLLILRRRNAPSRRTHNPCAKCPCQNKSTDS